MKIKRSGKHIFGAELTAAEKKAMDIEITKQLAEFTRKYQIEIECIFLRELRAKYGFGETRLKRAFDDFGNDLDELIARYELGDADRLWVATEQLRQDGFDVEKWHKAKYGND